MALTIAAAVLSINIAGKIMKPNTAAGMLAMYTAPIVIIEKSVIVPMSVSGSRYLSDD